MKKFLTIILFCCYMIAIPLEVHDTQGEIQQTTMIGKMADSIKKYEEMIQKANDQVNRLNQINDIMSKTNNFLKSSTLSIANPLQILETLKSSLSAMEDNYKRLSKTLKDWDYRDKIKSKRLANKCPWLRMDIISPQSLQIFFTQTGEETQLIKDAKRLIESLTDNTYQNLTATLGTLSGRALAEKLCEQVYREEKNKELRKINEMQKQALLKNDKKLFEELRIKQMQIEFHKILNDEMELQKKFEPLINRQEQMLEHLGVKDKVYNDKKNNIIYCKETQGNNEEFCYPLMLDTQRLNHDYNQLKEEFNEKLIAAGSNEESQAKVYADINQKASLMLLDYTKDLSNGIAFMNETLSLIGSLMAEDFQRKYHRNLNTQQQAQDELKTEEEIKAIVDENRYSEYEIEFDQFGFPKIFK
ncbi:hypothetical protein [Helicobacter anatolicus]|uniref:hypothetical protein n=1 Tax=Helicobacter anatolicus TaxID=2905874 RepID=UPI001E4EF010|nr:hypothetical protein [Helicobacter anatolicus]MCE3037695.1 hypothetical protein [Helicobacter anatolicus]MCE3040018.1 hypothetical protein [Helicobacter anatolicus]